MYKVTSMSCKKKKSINPHAMSILTLYQKGIKEGMIPKPKRKQNTKDRFERSLRRTQQRIKEILENNLDDYSYFVTLTYKENIQSYEQANKDFKKFVRGLDLKYLNVTEHQDRGAIHFHMIIFDYKDDILKILNRWQNGFKYQKKIKNKYAYSISRYFTKYLTKENQLVFNNKRVFSTSKNLNQSMMIDDYVIEHYRKKDGYAKDYKKEDFEMLDALEYAKIYFGVDKVVIKE